MLAKIRYNKDFRYEDIKRMLLKVRLNQNCSYCLGSCNRRITKIKFTELPTTLTRSGMISKYKNEQVSNLIASVHFLSSSIPIVTIIHLKVQLTPSLYE